MADVSNSLPTSKPIQDSAASGYSGSGDRIQLIDDDQEYVAAETEIPTNTGTNGQRTEISPLQLEDTSGILSKRKTQEGLKVVVISSITFAITVTIALILTIVLGPPAVPPHGAVSCDSQQCSDVGVTILKKKGSAVDAAIATALCLGVVNPHHSGIGGGMFMVIRLHKENTSTIINARETAPSGAKEAIYTDAIKLKLGELAVGVPGELKGYKAAHDLYGKLSWKDVVTPAADIARNGFNISQFLAYAISTAIDPDSDLDADLRRLFYRDDRPLKEGDTLVLSDLSGVLDDIANNGIDSFYDNGGKYAQEISETTNTAVTIDDLYNYGISQVHTLKKSFRNMSIETMPSPGGGPLVVFIMNVLHEYGLNKSNLTDPLYYHRLVESIKFMAGEKSRFGDPLFVDDMENATDLITSKDYAAFIRSQIIDDATHNASYYMLSGGSSPDSGTAQISVIGPDEDLISITSSVNQYFGSHLVTVSGIILNNVMADFDLPTDTGEPVNMNNNIEPGKRPLSSMSPTIVHRFGKPCAARIALGGVNGTQIISGIAQVLLDLLAFGKNITEAIEIKRLSNMLDPDQLEYDAGFNTTILTYLSSLGHNIQVEDPRGVSYVHAVAKINETVMGHADGREENSGDTIF